MIVGLSEQSEGWTGWDAEYLHYGLMLTEGLRFSATVARRLRVPIYGWTRNSRNRAALFSRSVGEFAGALLLEWLRRNEETGSGTAPGGSAATAGSAQLSLERQGRRFDLSPAASGELRPSSVGEGYRTGEGFSSKSWWRALTTSDPATFTEVRVAGAIVGLSTRSGVWMDRMPSILITRFTPTAKLSPDDRLASAQRRRAPGPWTCDGRKGGCFFAIRPAIF